LKLKCLSDIIRRFDERRNIVELNITNASYLTLGAGVVGVIYANMLTNKIKSNSEGTDRMVEIAGFIREGARAFISAEYGVLYYFVAIVAILLGFMVNPGTAVAFLLGAACSMFAGKMGMETATASNARTANAAREKGLTSALEIAFSGGAVMGLWVCGLGLIGYSLLMIVLPQLGFIQAAVAEGKDLQDYVLHCLSGFGLGASSIALFARVGGGIFTKAADVGADLVGKVEAGIPEDDPRNPAVIADNVGDNVGDVAGMGADLFESYVGSMIAACAIGYAMLGVQGVILPLVIVAIGIISSIVGMQFVKTNDENKIHSALTFGVIVASALCIGGMLWACKSLIIVDMNVQFFKDGFTGLGIFFAVLSGLVAGFLIGQITEHYTGADKPPVAAIAKSSLTGPATVIIEGMAIGMRSTVLPMIMICLAIFVAFHFAGMYGIAMAAIGMLSTVAITVAIDAYGPIADNAGGIAEMAELPKGVRVITDKLDAVGNTTAAIGKGFAIGSAALTALALFSAFTKETGLMNTGINLTSPHVVIGLFLGGILPYLFSAMTMQAVGRAAMAMIDEVRRQFREDKGIMAGTSKPDYKNCVAISTNAAIAEMIVPGVIAIVVPLLVGKFMGAQALGGLLAGSLVSGVCLAIMMANAGGAWDNAKKYIEAGELKDGNGTVHGKGSEPHKAAVVGDTVGDPFKDTSGPSINIFIKLVSIVSLVCAPMF